MVRGPPCTIARRPSAQFRRVSAIGVSAIVLGAGACADDSAGTDFVRFVANVSLSVSRTVLGVGKSLP